MRFTRAFRLLTLAAAAAGAASAALAAGVTSEQAQTAARNWVSRSPARMTARFASSSVAGVQTSEDAAGRTLCHVVNLAGGGYVVTAGDTKLPPVIAFSDSGELDLSDAGNPLCSLLERDMGSRVERLSAASPKATAAKNAAASQAASPFEAEWAELLDDNPAKAMKCAASASMQTSIPDVRVAPLVKSQWNQDYWNGYATFNYYTPNGYVSGCVATAFAQIMRYWQMPRASVAAQSFYCKVDDRKVSKSMYGGTYDWANMPLTEADCTSATQRKAIGRLLYDLGVASRMSWSRDSSGTLGFSGSQALKKVFGYASSQAYFDVSGWGLESALSKQTDFRDAILASLDAGMPCAVGVGSDYGGHEMVLDGYGFSGSVIYTHLNCGWSGSEDAWYNFLGEAVTSDGYDYMDELGYNIHPTTAGDVLSGRVLDSSGGGVSGATVVLSLNGDRKATTTTNAKGIYAFRISSAGTYAVSAEYGGRTGATTASVAAMSASTTAELDDDLEYNTSASNGRLGNKWGVNVTLSDTYAIRFHKNDGSGATASRAFAYGVKTRLPLLRSGLGWARGGFVFKGWATSAAKAAAGTVWKGDWAYVSTAAQSGKTLDVYAVWAPDSGYYVIRFNKNDGSGAWRTVAFPFGTTRSLPTCAAGLGWMRGGKAFVGWAVSAAKAGSPVVANIWKVDQDVVAKAAAAGATLDVYAAWVDGYAIRFHKNDGSALKRAQGFAMDTKTRIPASKNGLGWTRPGYVFKGWATSAAKAAAGTVWKGDWAYVTNATSLGGVLNAFAVWARQ